MMTITQPVEYCSKCGEPTGRAGRDEDSIYIGETGPLCENCTGPFSTGLWADYFRTTEDR